MQYDTGPGGMGLHSVSQVYCFVVLRRSLLRACSTELAMSATKVEPMPSVSAVVCKHCHYDCELDAVDYAGNLIQPLVPQKDVQVRLLLGSGCWQG